MVPDNVVQPASKRAQEGVENAIGVVRARRVAGHGDIGSVGIILDKKDENSSGLVPFLGGAGCQGKIAEPWAANGIVQGDLSSCFKPALLKEWNRGKSSLAFCKRITCHSAGVLAFYV